MQSSKSIFQHPALSLIGRLLLASVFIISGLGKIANTPGTVAVMGAHGIPLPEVLVYPTLLFELLGGLSLALGLKARVGAGLLLIFLLPTTLIFHAHLADRLEMVQLTKNLSIMGGLLFILANGPGKWALVKEN